MSGKREFYSCSECGRDTAAAGGVCKDCRAENNRSRGTDEYKGRKTRSRDVVYGTPIEDVRDERRTSSDRYNGESCRDDL